MHGIEIVQLNRKIRKADGKCQDLFRNFNLTVGTGEVLGIMGPNGCGKTTLLNLVAGILLPDEGEIRVWGKVPSQQGIAYIFQNYRESLFPWLSVKDNILFPLFIKGISKSEKLEKIESLIELFRPPFELDKYPYQLSGGQQQYAALMRSLISDPSVMLFDEPFSALDYENSIWLMEKIKDILKKIKIPALIVAHERTQLYYLSHRICVLSGRPLKIIDEAIVEPGLSCKTYGYNNLLQGPWELALKQEKEGRNVRHNY